MLSDRILLGNSFKDKVEIVFCNEDKKQLTTNVANDSVETKNLESENKKVGNLAIAGRIRDQIISLARVLLRCSYRQLTSNPLNYSTYNQG